MGAVPDQPPVQMRPIAEMYKAFPHKKIRDIQKDVLDLAYQKLQEKDYVVLELPPGSGKSAIGWTLANAFPKAYMVTVQKILQQQYDDEMGNLMAVVKGQNAYTCGEHPEYTCEEAPCSLKKSIRKEHGDMGLCPYVTAMREGKGHPYAMFNLHSFYYQYKYGWFKGEGRDLLVVDEAHLIENTFMSLIEVRLTSGFSGVVPELPRYFEAVKYRAIISDVLRRIGTVVDEAEDRELQGQELGPDELKRVATLSRLSMKLSTLFQCMETEEWVVSQEESKRGEHQVVFKPLYVHRFVTESLFASAPKVVLMSATVGSLSQFCKRIGIPVDRTCVIRGPSPFPVENRPIFYVAGSGKMSRAYQDKSFPGLVKNLSSILRDHEGERGIIQAHSERLASRLADELQKEFGARLTVKNGDMMAMLEAHKKKPGSVIISAGTSTGLDLKDDLSRFQCLVKIPFPDLGDPQMKRRQELDGEYYAYLTALTLAQAYGRSIRHETDKAETYILDGDWGYFKKLWKHLIPDWFLEAVQTL